MSFFNLGEKVFGGPQAEQAQKMRTGKMLATSSFADPRAWSLDSRKQAAFIMDSMMRSMSSNGDEAAMKNGSNAVTDERKRPPMKDTSFSDNLDDIDCEITKLKNKLEEAKEKIEELQQINQTMAHERTKTTEEVGNLRLLVSDMHEQLQSFGKIENLPTFNSSENELEEAKLEILHLSEKLKAYSELRQWHSELRQVYDDLLDERKELSRTLDQLVTENAKHAKELQTKEKQMALLERRVAIHGTSQKAEIVLRNRLAGKNGEIEELKAALCQRVAVNEGLNAKILAVTECFENKEENLTQEIKELRNTVEGQSVLIKQLQTKLHETELLVAELEALRDQLRKTNSALTDNVSTYQADLFKTRRHSDELLTAIQRLQKVSDDREKEIEELKLFPHSPNTKLLFCHLNKLVMSTEESDIFNQEQQAELWRSVKCVIVKLKEDMWGSNITPLELQLHDVLIQTDQNRRDYELQCSPEVRSVDAQTLVPVEYTSKLDALKQVIDAMCSRVVSLEGSLEEHFDEFDSLETLLFDNIEASYLKDLKLERCQSNEGLLLGAMELLSAELRQAEALLVNALKEVQCQVEANEIVCSTIWCSVEQYSGLLRELEALTRRKDEHIENLENWVVMLELRQDDSEELKSEVGRLIGSLDDKCRQVDTLENELSSMLAGSIDRVGLSRVDAWTDPLPPQGKPGQTKASAWQTKQIAQIRAKLMKVSRRRRRDKLRLHHLNGRLAIAADLKSSNDELKSEKSVLLMERHILVEELCSLKMKFAELEATLDKYKAKQVAHSELKMKMEKMALKLMKKVTKYKTALNDFGDGTRSFGLSENLNYEVDQLKMENMSLSSTICDLKQKLAMLLELPEKNSSSVELQVSLGDVKDPLNAIKTHYEELVLKMKREHDAESEQERQKNLNHFKILVNSYERELLDLQQSHSDNLEKLQTLHQEEQNFLLNDKLQLQLNDQRAILENEFAAERASLQHGYQARLKLLETSFEEEREELETQFQSQSSALLETIENMASSHKKEIMELKETHRVQLDRFDQQLEFELVNRINLKKAAAVDAKTQCSPNERQTRGTDACSRIDSRNVYCNTDVLEDDVCCPEATTKGGTSVCSGDLMMNPEKAILFARIADLEASLHSQQVEFARKSATANFGDGPLSNNFLTALNEFWCPICLAKHNEKKYKHELMKTKEIAQILDQELKYSADVHCKLGVQFNRAEQLKLEKEVLASHLFLCEKQLSQLRSATKDQRHETSAPQRCRALRNLGAGEFELPPVELNDKVYQAPERDRIWTTVESYNLNNCCQTTAANRT